MCVWTEYRSTSWDGTDGVKGRKARLVRYTTARGKHLAYIQSFDCKCSPKLSCYFLPYGQLRQDAALVPSRGVGQTASKWSNVHLATLRLHTSPSLHLTSHLTLLSPTAPFDARTHTDTPSYPS